MRLGGIKGSLYGVSVGALLYTMPALAADSVDAEVDRAPVITVTATRAPIEVQDAPSTVTVIDEKRIADELATDIKDLVRFEPGVSVQRQPARFGAALGVTGRAGNDGFNIRGIGGNRVLTQVDGVRVPDGFEFGAQSAGRGDYVDIGLVKSVEILRGPASALYGSDGLAGAVSFITADPSDFLNGDNNVGGLLRAQYSSADQEFAETAILAGRSGDWSVLGAFTRRDYKELDNQGTLGNGTTASGAGSFPGTGANRTAANPQDGHSNAGFARVVWDPSNGHKVRLTGEYLETNLFTDVLSGRTATVDLLRARDTGHRGRVAADWSWEGEGTLQFARVGLFWQDGEDRQFTDEDRTPAADRERLNTFENRVIGASAEARFGFETGAIAHRLIIGGDVSKTRQEGIRDGVLPTAPEVFPVRAFPITNYVLAGAYLSDQIEFGPVTLYPALRFDAYDHSPKADALYPGTPRGSSGSRVSPKLGAVVKLDEAVRLFANYGRGFRAPEPSQINQFFQNLTSPFGAYRTIPNPDLKPETSESFEGGVRLFNDAVSLDVTAFHGRYKNFILRSDVGGTGTIADPDVFQFTNVSRVEISGAEAKFQVRSTWGMTGNLALSYATGDTIAPSGAKTPLQTIDPLKLVVGVGYDDPGNVFGGRIIATHSARKEDDRTGCAPSACFTGKSFTILDATAYVRITPELTLRGGIFNITDEKYWLWSDIRGLTNTITPPATVFPGEAYAQPGRNGSVSVSYRF